MIIIQTETSQGHQVHLAPQELLGQEENLDLEEDQDSLDHLGFKGHLVKEVNKFTEGSCTVGIVQRLPEEQSAPFTMSA